MEKQELKESKRAEISLGGINKAYCNINSQLRCVKESDLRLWTSIFHNFHANLIRRNAVLAARGIQKQLKQN